MRPHARILLATLAPLLSGCATVRSTIDGWATGRDGLSRSQRELRNALSTGDFASVLARREDDALLQALTSGITMYYAAQYERSAAMLDTAVLLSEERVTASLSRNTLALVTNDMARPYQARRTERLFIPYYGMLAYAKVGQWEDAAVEARRMVALLAQFGADADERERPLHAAMHFLAGVVFQRDGERGAAEVAYRNAHVLTEGFPARPTRGAAAGDVMVVVERGFVAHRTTETIRITLGDDDREDLRGGDESRRRAVDRLGARMGWAPASAQPQAFRQRTTESVVDVGGGPLPGAPSTSRRHQHDDDDDDDHDAHHLSIAFPSLRRSPRPWAGAPRLLEDSIVAPVGTSDFQVAASVDDASAVDERRERASMATRELARAAARYALAKAARDKGGDVAGEMADLGASFMERADVRSWHLLPQELVLMRVRLPEGRHHLRVEVGEGTGVRVVDLGMVMVKAGEAVLLPARLWREPAPESPARCRHHRGACDY